MAKQPATTKSAENEAPVAEVDEVVTATPAPATPAAPAPEPELEVRISVQEFCTRKMDTDPRSYPGLAAFLSREEREGRQLDTVSAFEKRYKDMMESHPKH